MNRTTLIVLASGVALAAILAGTGPADDARPLRPSPSDIVETLSGPPRSPRADSAQQAARHARALISASRNSGGDVRLLGQAMAVLEPWRDTADPTVRLLHATVAQSLHDFAGAQRELDALTHDDPSNAQAWLTRATVSFVQGEFGKTHASCAALDGLVDPVVRVLCDAPVRALEGQGEAVRTELEALEPTAGQHRAWLLSMRGEIEHWLGHDAAAAESLEYALRLDETDTYTRILLSRVLVARGAPIEAVALFSDRSLNDAELLRLVLALEALPRNTSNAARAELDRRIAAGRRRGETLHQREESEYALHLEKNAPLALELAWRNWSTQREPEDARVLLDAGLAANDARAVSTAREWLAHTVLGAER